MGDISELQAKLEKENEKKQANGDAAAANNSGESHKVILSCTKVSVAVSLIATPGQYVV